MQSTEDGALVLRRYADALEVAAKQEAAEEERLGNELQQRATEIAGMLSVVCPKCGMVQDPDPSGCIAVRCGHCSEAYCWMCFELCGRDAHAHAIQAHKTYFPSRALVAAWHRRWRWWRVFAALDKHYPIGTGAGAPAAKAKRAKLLVRCRTYLEQPEVGLGCK